MGWKAAQGWLGQGPWGLPSPDNPAGFFAEGHVTILVIAEIHGAAGPDDAGFKPRWLHAVVSVWAAFVP